MVNDSSNMHRENVIHIYNNECMVYKLRIVTRKEAEENK